MNLDESALLDLSEAREQQIERLHLVIAADDRFLLGASVRCAQVRERAHDLVLHVFGRSTSAG